VSRTPAWLKAVVRWVRDGSGGDITLAVALFVLSFVPGIAHQGTDLGVLPDRVPMDAVGVFLLLAQSLPLAVRRRWPAVCLAVVCGAFAAFQLLGYATAFASLGMVVSLYSAGAHLRRGRVAVAVAAVGAYVVFAFGLHAVGSPEQPQDYLMFGLVLAAFWAVGAWVRDRAAREADRRRLAEEAVVTAERGRIARELHDVVTHHVTAMVVQADAAQFLPPDRVTTSLSAIGGSGRHALTDLRYLLGALDGNSAKEPAAGDLPDLVARSRAAGQPVELVEHGQARPMASAAEVAAYRVVQEALTNALKHAAGSRTVVNVHHSDEWMDLEVSTDKSSRPGLGRGSGRGLLGLRERVNVVGGDLRANSRPDGGFTVWARIPLEIS
jgi:signal transduction histidine kinase